MGDFVLNVLGKLEEEGKLDAGGRVLLEQELNMLRAGYLYWKKSSLARPWYVAIIPITHGKFNDRMIMLARKRPNMLKDTKMKPVKVYLESLGFQVQWAKRVVGTMRKDRGEPLTFVPDETASQPSGFARRLKVLAKGYKLVKLMELVWVHGDDVEELSDSDLGDDTFAFMAEPPFCELEYGDLGDLSDEELEAAADETEDLLLDIYLNLGVDLAPYEESEFKLPPDELPEGETYCQWLQANRSKAHLALLTELMQTVDESVQRPFLTVEVSE